MEKLVFIFILGALFGPYAFATALDDFYEAQFQCNPDAKQYIEVKNKDKKSNPDFWTIISDFKNTEITPNPKIEKPHRRFRLHYRALAILDCGGGAIKGPKNYEEAVKLNKDQDRDAIVILYLSKDGGGRLVRIDYEATQKAGMDSRENGMSYLNLEIAGRDIINCASKMEDLVVGKSKIDIEKICASEVGKAEYKKDYEKTKADLDRLMGYWRKAAKEKEQTKAK